MAKAERCPICNVPVKPENLVRHLDDNHPRHPEATALRQKIKEDARYAPPRRRSRGFRIRRTHVAAVAVVVLIGAGLYVAAPFFDPYYGFNRDSCIDEAAARYHIHPWLMIVIDGSPVIAPTNIGISGNCTKPVHTHDSPGDVDATRGRKIHVESPLPREFTLGDFFAIWDETLSPSQILDCRAGAGRTIQMTVNEGQSTAFGNLVLQDGQDIRITCGLAS